MKLEGKVAIVIGGARGIGKAYSEALADKGAKVSLGDILDEEGQDTVTKINGKHGQGTAYYVRCDVTSEDDIKKIFVVTKEQFGNADIVVYNSGTIQETQWKDLLQINLVGCIFAVNEAVKLMGKHEGGSGGVFIATASQVGLDPWPYTPVYCASKAGVLGLIRAWGSSKIIEKIGIRFNAICPASVDTNMPLQIKHNTLFPEVTPDMAAYPKMKPSFIGEGLLKLLDDDTLNGQALRCSLTHGHDFATLPTWDFI